MYSMSPEDAARLIMRQQDELRRQAALERAANQAAAPVHAAPAGGRADPIGLRHAWSRAMLIVHALTTGHGPARHRPAH